MNTNLARRAGHRIIRPEQRFLKYIKIEIWCGGPTEALETLPPPPPERLFTPPGWGSLLGLLGARGTWEEAQQTLHLDSATHLPG